jgi:hypothetical protein
MPSTWMELTNKLLRRTNDVEITESDFASAKGIQAAAKDYIQDVVREINTTKPNWPFNAVEHSQSLNTGVEEYAWPINFTAAEWDSFQIQANATHGNSFQALHLTTRDEWYTRQRDLDYESLTAGRDLPTHVFPSHGQGFGVTPSPDQDYNIKFRYYKDHTALSLFSSQVTIPDKFDYVIISGALTYMSLFKENIEGVQLMKQQFKEGISNMVNIFLPNETYVYSPRFQLGGGQKSYFKNMWIGQ